SKLLKTLSTLLQSTPQTAHTPRSRSNTFSRRYPGSLRSLCSWTQGSEQKDRLPLGTSTLHHRHSALPLGPLESLSIRTQPAFGEILWLLIGLLYRAFDSIVHLGRGFAVDDSHHSIFLWWLR